MGWKRFMGVTELGSTGATNDGSGGSEYYDGMSAILLTLYMAALSFSESLEKGGSGIR